MKKYVALVILFVVLVAGWLIVKKNNGEQAPTDQSVSQTTVIGKQKKAAHFETSTPAHSDILPGAPTAIVLNFNFDLAKPSSITVVLDEKEYTVGETIIDDNQLTMRRAFTADAPDGTYQVTYRACWPDKSCHDGQFQFIVDRSTDSSYLDLLGQKEVTVDMKQYKFVDPSIRIASGTKVTWINSDSDVHFVNTDSHPAHTYFPIQNSRSLKKGEKYSVVFTEAGFYPYHCSAHATTMTGGIIVHNA